MSDTSSTEDDDEEYAVVLDFLAHGRSDGRSYGDGAVAYAVSTADFTLYELSLAGDADITILDRVRVRPDFEDGIERGHTVEYDDLSDGARSELDYVVEDVVDANERRFVDFYSDAQPISLRLHQLNLLPGIGDKLRDNILDERKRRGPFESFEDVGERVDGLHNPREVVVERILEEIRDDDLKYYNFASS
jgi:putative nucleotide binding protein